MDPMGFLPFTPLRNIYKKGAGPRYKWALLAIVHWFFDRDPYDGLLSSQHNWVILGSSITDLYPKQAESPFFSSLQFEIVSNPHKWPAINFGNCSRQFPSWACFFRTKSPRWPRFSKAWCWAFKAAQATPFLKVKVGWLEVAVFEAWRWRFSW